MGIVLGRNSRALIADLKLLISLTDQVPSVPSPTPDDHPSILRAFALASLVMGREMAQGVASEASAGDPRGPNGIRLSRHIWELELELHYCQADPGTRLDRLLTSEQKARLKLMTNETFRKAREEELAALTPEDREKRKREDQQLEAEYQQRIQDNKPMPSRYDIADALGRKNEYGPLYSGSSWLSHPGVALIDAAMRPGSDGLLHPEGSQAATAYPGMAVSHARTCFSRLARRCYGILGDHGGVTRLREFMDARGIAETGPPSM